MATASCMAVHAPVPSPASARQIDSLCKLVARAGSKRGGLAWARRRRMATDSSMAAPAAAWPPRASVRLRTFELGACPQHLQSRAP
jgi:hypothetical protein